MNNHVFIEGQNLHLGVKEAGWKIDHTKFRRYLLEKYRVSEAYYFLGFISEDEQILYNNLQKAGLILSFKEHSSTLKGQKKGNVDSEIIFSIMKKIIDNEPFDKIVLVSGDGDYKKLADFLAKRNQLGKILFPNTSYASSLYKKLGSEHYDYLDTKDIRNKIE